MGHYLQSCRLDLRLVSRVVDSLAVAGEGVEDLVGGLGPDEGLGVSVPLVDPAAQVSFEFDHAAMGRAAQFAVGQFGEPALDQVEPGGAGGGEVQVEPGMAQQPVLDRWGFVGGIDAPMDVKPQLVGRVGLMWAR